MMSFGDFTYKLFYRPQLHYIPWPDHHLGKKNILVEDLKPHLRRVNFDYGFDDATGAYAPMEVHVLNPRLEVVRTYLIQMLI